MKKILCLILALVLVFSFAACGGGEQSGTEGSGDFEWTREGQFEDGNDNYLMVYKSDNEDYPDTWGVSVMLGEEMHGWFIPQEGETLHGDLTAEYEEGADPYVVTISEEGEDGLLMETEAGDQYHFTPMDVPEILYTLQINTDGLGTVAYAPEGEEPEFEEDFPTQSAVKNITEGEPTSYTLAAKADEGYKFIKWTKNGKDFSTDEKITIEVTEDVEYRAVFEFDE